MAVLRIDHIHIKANAFTQTVAALESIMGGPFMLPEMDFDEEGMKVAYNAFPMGFEVMSVNDSSKELAALYEKWPGGVFALSLRVDDIKESTAHMEELGYKALVFHEFGDIHEVLFDTTVDLDFYIELVEAPDIMTAEGAGF